MGKNLFQKLNNHRALGGPAGELGPDTTNCSVASISALRVRVTGAQHPFDYARTSDGPDAQTQRSRPPAALLEKYLGWSTAVWLLRGRGDRAGL